MFWFTVVATALGAGTSSSHDSNPSATASQCCFGLLAALPAEDEKVVLVGRSYRGLNIALAAAACIFPHKISLTVFLTDTIHRPSYVLEQLDTEFCDRGRLKTQHVVRSKGLIVPSLSTMLQRGCGNGKAIDEAIVLFCR
ncbi:hypothetical protein K1719_014792 [Acacia pycnantha]|nr:hypothetical protein K1719_014792 [Acacia pycnantha]